MSLFLTQPEMWDRSVYGKNREHEITHWFGNIAYVIAGLICKIICRYRVRGRQNLRALKGKSGAVVIANHTSFTDVAFLFCAVRPSQWLRLMARETLFAKGWAGQMISRLGGFPVKRDSADRTSVKRAVRMLKNQELVGIFPEGTRRGKGSQTPKLHAGAALIARMGHAPIVPATIRNAEKIKIKGEHYFHWPTVYVVFGEPISVDSFDFLPKDERLEACTWYAMRECFALSKEIPADQVNMAELFPESKDYSAVFAAHPIERCAPEQQAQAADGTTGAEQGAESVASESSGTSAKGA